MASGRIVGIDFGTRRVGIAVSDPLRMFSQPLGTYDPSGAVEMLRGLRDRDGIDTVVIGWPLDEEGREGPATRRVDEFVRRLRNALGRITVVRVDERYTSEAVKDTLAGGFGARTRGRVDTAVAGLLLQEYLDALPGEGNV